MGLTAYPGDGGEWLGGGCAGGRLFLPAEYCSVFMVLVSLLPRKKGPYRLEEMVDQGTGLAVTVRIGGAALTHLSGKLPRRL